MGQTQFGLASGPIRAGFGFHDAQRLSPAHADKVSIVFPLAPAWALAWRHRSRSLAALAAWVLVAGLAPGLGHAQEGDGVAARVSKLEAEIATLKVVVGTLESLVRTKPVPAQMRGSQTAEKQDDLGPRVHALETQIGALTNQIEQAGRQMSALQAKLEAAPQAAAPSPPVAESQAVTPAKAAAPKAKAPPLSAVKPVPEVTAKAVPPPVVKPVPQATAKPLVLSPQAAAPKPVAPPATVISKAPSNTSKAHWYGPRPGAVADNSPQTIVPPGAATGSLPDDEPQSLATLPDSNAQALYEQGYGALLQRDYRAAEAAFSKMVAGYPNDPLAGSAQYWVGETQYIRKQYKKAADSFLAGYRKYSSGNKAPDTLVKLGMSLAALGEKDAACTTFKQLKEKFPDAPDYLRNQAKGEAGKAGC